jgi:hypothetical protein
VLNDVKHREAHKILYSIDTDTFSATSFDIIGVKMVDANQQINYNGLKTTCKQIVRGDFNEISTLIHHGLLEEEIFIEEYYWVILKIWNLLRDEIKDTKAKTGQTNYMEHLEELEKKAAEYTKKYYPKVYETFYPNKPADSNDTNHKAQQT